jgi:Flp pilus assembly protein TadG
LTFHGDDSPTENTQMMIRKRNLPARRGVSMVEAAVVYPITMLLMMGTLVMGIGVFRYEQLQSLAREGARYASVHGPGYAADNPPAAIASTTDIQNNVLTPMAAGMTGVGVTLTWNPNPPTTTTPSVVTVVLTYTWVPEGIWKTSAAFTATSTMPVVY